MKCLMATLLAVGVLSMPGSAGAETLASLIEQESAAVDRLIEKPFALAADAGSAMEICDKYMAKAGTLRAALEKEQGRAEMGTTFRRFDNLQRILAAAASDGSLLGQVGEDEARRSVGRDCAGRAALAGNAIMLSRTLYERLKAIDTKGADPSAKYVLENTLATYDRAGVGLAETQRARIEELKARISKQEIAFGANIANSRNTITVTPAQLSGLPADFLASHPAGPDGLITISTDTPDYTPVMFYAADASVRRRLLVASLTRAHPANDTVLRGLLADRDALARELGRPDFASLVLEDKMLDSPARVRSVLDEAAAAAKPLAERDQARILRRLRVIDPLADAVPLWSKDYLQQLIRKEDYAVDPQEVRRYFAYDRVRDGIFKLSEDLFDVEIRPWRTATWHPSVEALEMYDHGTLVGRFYVDAHPRDGKYGHANVVPLRVGLTDRGVPMAALVANFPQGDHKTGLMEHRDVVVFLHEYGHLLHVLFSGNKAWQSGAGTLERDFIEAPSQMLENWVWDYDTLKGFAVDENGQTIPRALVERMNASRRFGEALGDRQQMGFANVALSYHLGPPPADLGTAFRRAEARYDPTPMPDEAQPHDSFIHLGNNSAYYYAYIWSKVISTDLFSRVRKNGLRDAATARRYRELVLEPSGTKPAAALIADFLGRPVSIHAYQARLAEGQ